MRPLRLLLGVVLFVSSAAGISEHEIARFKGAPKRLQGTVTDRTGAPIPWTEIEVYNNPAVWDESSLTLVQMRTKQKKIASGSTDESGHFKIRKVQKGLYEVQFTRTGWNTFSVLLNVDPHGEDLCTELRISGGSGENRVKPCR